MISAFFIRRPIFSCVISIIIVIAGLVSLETLPISQYPDISPPTVQVSCNYPGASAQIVAQTVGQPIEEQVNGVEGMIYMSSTSANDGSYNLTVTFEVGTDMDMATVLVQNRVAIASPNLPSAVTQLGVTTKKKSTNIVLMMGLTSDNPAHDDLFLSNYVTLRIKDELARLYGVGDVFNFGAGDYSMRVWLDPEKMEARNLTVDDVNTAISEQNVQVAAGQIGQPPSPKGQKFQYVINAQGRLDQVTEFENIILRVNDDGGILHLGDVSRVELGSKTYTMASKLNGKGCAMLGVYQLPGANALNLADTVRSKMEELSKNFPGGMKYTIALDTTMFVHASIDEVVETLVIAIILVFLVIYIFLQDWRTTLIPAATIPVSLIGTFIVMAGLGFSLNMLTLFGIVLAIGIVVDDAIVVVENAERNMSQFGLAAREATIKAMEEVSGPIYATTFVLLAVFVPTAFLGGITGQMYKQFALTIAASTVFSSINALTLSPALCALVLKEENKSHNFLMRGFNWAFERVTRVYVWVADKFTRLAWLSMLGFAGICALTFFGFTSLPTGFVPNEDQGYAMINIQLPDAASLERTESVVERMNKAVSKLPGIDYWMSVSGYSLLDGGASSNAAAMWVVFKPWDERKTPELHADGLIQQINRVGYSMDEAAIVSFAPPAIQGLGTTGGFALELEDRGNIGLPNLQSIAEDYIQKCNTQSGLSTVYTTFRANVPQLFFDLDRVKAKNMGVGLDSIFGALQTYLGQKYVNDFTKFGRNYQVNVQADAGYRATVQDIRQLQVTNAEGDMTPLSSMAEVTKTLGPQIVVRYNMYPSATINGSPAPGYSSGQAMAIMESTAASVLPESVGYDWTGISFQEKQSGSEAILIYLLAVIFVYLVLCAQYESWTISLGVILAVPLALIGTTAGLMIRHLDVNIYTQIGIVLLIGLACKNAILIVEFCKDAREKEGMSIREAAMEAARLRFRPILMTSFAFILGVFPLVVASGAGAESRHALGTAVFAGMISATLLGVLFVPVFYVVIETLTERLFGKKAVAKPEQKDIAS